jgi:5-methylcytosine-specific restriction endonuclease McrA
MRSSGAVLREVKNGGWSRRLSLIGWRYEFAVGSKTLTRPLGRGAWEVMSAHQRAEPVSFLEADGRAWWWFEDAFYWEDEQLEPADVLALIRDRERRRKRKLERAHTALVLDREQIQRRQPIPREVKLAVFERDGGRCVMCGSAFELQYDHVIPVAMNGASTVENLQLMCAECNQRKGASLG